MLKLWDTSHHPMYFRRLFGNRDGPLLNTMLPSRQWEPASSTALPTGKREAVKASSQEGGNKAHQEGGREIQRSDAEPRTRGHDPEASPIKKPLSFVTRGGATVAAPRAEEDASTQPSSPRQGEREAKEVCSKAACKSGREVTGASQCRCSGALLSLSFSQGARTQHNRPSSKQQELHKQVRAA